MMDTYKNYELLTETRVRNDSTDATFKRGLSVIASVVGKRLVLDRWGVPSVVSSFAWSAYGRAEIATLKAFIARRKGRIAPCWVSTDNADLILAQDTLAGQSTIRIKRIGYTQLVFPTGNGRRHVSVKKKDGTLQAFKVASCLDNLDGTETLVLDGQLSDSYPAGAHFSYLTLCRLESDEVRIAYTSPHVCDTQLNFVELPKETP